VDLEEIIIEKIKQKRGITFRDFMEIALYYPGYGYYTSPGEKIGRRGDYYTSPDVGSVFGELFCIQLKELWEIMDKKRFTILEIGAGKGLLCRDILEYSKRYKEFSESINYVIVEKSPQMTERQKRTIQDDRVSWENSLKNLSIEGCIISNELIDSFPVHIVEMRKGKLWEVYVTYKEGFVEELRPPSTPLLEEYLSQLEIKLKEGFRIEINLDALEWIKNVANTLRRGFVITVDYGYTAEELNVPHRARGTLLCYYKHSAYNNPYERIGLQDITTHVNFSALTYWGRLNGLELCGYTDQAHFILGLLEEYFRAMEDEYQEYYRKLQQIKRLILPGEMGETFKVLVQYKGVRPPKIKGMKYAKDSFSLILKPKNRTKILTEPF